MLLITFVDMVPFVMMDAIYSDIYLPDLKVLKTTGLEKMQSGLELFQLK